MADFDFSSFGRSLLPSEITIGANGARVGFGTGRDEQLAIDKANADIAFKNIAAQQAHQQLLLEREKAEVQKSYYLKLKENIDASLKASDLAFRKEEWAFKNAERDDASRMAYADTIEDPHEKRMYLDKDSRFWELRKTRYRNAQEYGVAVAAAGSYRLPPGVTPEGFAEFMGADGMRRLIEDVEKTKNNIAQNQALPRQNYHAIGVNEVGFGVLNQQTGQASFQTWDSLGAANPGMKQADRQKAFNAMQSLYAKETDGLEGILKPAFDDWFQRPERQLYFGLQAKTISPAQYDFLTQALAKKRADDREFALPAMKRAYEEANKHNWDPGSPEMEKRWARYLTEQWAAPNHGRAGEWIDWAAARKPFKIPSGTAAVAQPDVPLSSTPARTQPFSIDVRPGAAEAGSDRKTIMGPGGAPYNVPRSASQAELAKVQEALNASRGQASPAPAVPSQRSAPRSPKPGDVQEGYRFKGGNPGDRSN